MRSSSSDNKVQNAAKNFQKIRWRNAAFLLAENAVFLLTVYSRFSELTIFDNFKISLTPRTPILINLIQIIPLL